MAVENAAARLKDVALTDLRLRCEILEAAERHQKLAVIRAREAGASWAEVGAALGVTHQSARERWGKLPELSGV